MPPVPPHTAHATACRQTGHRPAHRKPLADSIVSTLSHVEGSAFLREPSALAAVETDAFDESGALTDFDEATAVSIALDSSLHPCEPLPPAPHWTVSQSRSCTLSTVAAHRMHARSLSLVAQMMHIPLASH